MERDDYTDAKNRILWDILRPREQRGGRHGNRQAEERGAHRHRQH